MIANASTAWCGSFAFFILPVKIRWLALLTWIWYGYRFLLGDWMVRVMIAASVLNYFLFFGRDIWRAMKHGHRRMRHQARTLRTIRSRFAAMSRIESGCSSSPVLSASSKMRARSLRATPNAWCSAAFATACSS